MIKRAPVLVRALIGKDHVTADVMDLDQESFNAFTLGALMKLGAVQGVDSKAGGEMQEIEYRVREDRWAHYRDQLK
jgi:hypothetical protein